MSYSEGMLSVPAHFHAFAYNSGIHDMMSVYILWAYTYCSLNRGLKELILDDNQLRKEHFERIKREEMEEEARLESNND